MHDIAKLLEKAQGADEEEDKDEDNDQTEDEDEKLFSNSTDNANTSKEFSVFETSNDLQTSVHSANDEIGMDSFGAGKL